MGWGSCVGMWATITPRPADDTGEGSTVLVRVSQVSGTAFLTSAERKLGCC
jgi:hypothetical protein